MSSTIAFVGLGVMGLPMAEKLVAKQMRVIGFDMRREAIDRLEAAGGHGAKSAADAAKGANTLIVMVVNADQAEQVLFASGAVDALAPDATVIVMATCAPNRIVDMAARVEKTGRAFVDAPVSGGVVGIKNGTLTIMAAAPAAVLETAKPILLSIGSNLYHLGEKPGQGAAMKIVNQLLAGVHIAAAGEALALAERSGIDAALALKILSGSAAASWMLQNRGPRMLEAEPDVMSAVDIFVKDMGLVLDAGRTAKIGLPISATVQQLFTQASALGLGTKDDSKVMEVYRALGKPK